MNAEQTFRSKVPFLIGKLLGDFPIAPLDSFAIAGNGGYESAGFTKFQEISPTVKGSRGGFGWFQWTGPRRRAFEAYCKRNRLDPRSDKANYAWLFLELKGSERKAIGAVTRASGLRVKVEAFEQAYERAGVKHYASREQWARVAEDEWRGAVDRSTPEPTPTPAREKREMLEDEARASNGRAARDMTAGAGSGAAGGTSGGTGVDGFDPTTIADWLLVGIGAAALGLGIWLVWRALRNAGTAKALKLTILQEGL